MTAIRTIFFAAANPEIPNSKPIDWIKELKILSKVFRKSTFKGRYNIDAQPSITIKELRESFISNPWLFHFCGHGNVRGGIILEKDDRNGMPDTLEKDDLIRTLQNSSNLQCVILCSCYSANLIEELSFIEYTIGFKGNLENEDSIEFVKLFYQNFANAQTIPHAYQRTLDDFSSNKYKPKGEFEPVFKTKNTYVMNRVILQRDHDFKLHLQQEVRDKIEEIEKKVNSVNDELKPLLLNLIEENPFPNEVFWFVENKGNLVAKIGEIVKESDTERKRQYFIEEIDAMFDFLKTSLVSFDFRDFNKSDMKSIPKSSKKHEYIRVFDELIALIPESVKSEQFVGFFTDNVKYIKSLI